MKNAVAAAIVAVGLIAAALWANARDATLVAGAWTITKVVGATGSFAHQWVVGQELRVDPTGHAILPGGLRHGVVDPRPWPWGGWTLAYPLDDPDAKVPARLSGTLSRDGARLTLAGPAGLLIEASRPVP